MTTKELINALMTAVNVDPSVADKEIVISILEPHKIDIHAIEQTLPLDTVYPGLKGLELLV